MFKMPVHSFSICLFQYSAWGVVSHDLILDSRGHLLCVCIHTCSGTKGGAEQGSGRGPWVVAIARSGGIRVGGIEGGGAIR